MKRRVLRPVVELGKLTLALTLFPLCGQGPMSESPPPSSPPFDVDVTLHTDRPGREANRLLLGSNLQWVNGGDSLLRRDAPAFDERKLSLVQQIPPTVLRYPGGSHADTYRWRRGIGPMDQRGRNDIFFKRDQQPIRMGTLEFLELCETTGAIPLITVNAVTGSAEEAAAWVRHVNGQSPGASRRTGRPLPTVPFWEVGNEPYLRPPERPELWIDGPEFAQRANRFIRRMREADPSIQIGLPLRSDRIGALPATHFSDHARTVLEGLTERVDYVALHNAYLPVSSGDDSLADLYLASVAGSRVVERDLAAVRSLLDAYPTTRDAGLAITEYNAFYTVSGAPSDAYIASLTGALVVADLLRVFASAPDVLFANFWSLVGNWHFGAISNRGVKRPAFHVFRLYRELLRGSSIPLTIDSPTFDSPRVGFIPELQDTPWLSGLATHENGTLRILLINKHPARIARVALRAAGGERLGRTRSRTLSGPQAFDARDSNSEVTVAEGTPPDPGDGRFELPARSITLLIVDLAGGTPGA